MSRWEHKRWTLNAGDVRQVDQWMNFRSGWQQAGQRQQNKRLNKDWSANWTLIQTKLMRGWRAVGRPEKQRWGVEGKAGLGGAQVSRRKKGGKTDKVVHMERNNWTKNPNMTYKCETTGYVWRGTTAFKLLGTWHHWILLRRPQEHFQPRFWWQNQMFSTRPLRYLRPYMQRQVKTGISSQTMIFSEPLLSSFCA